MRKGKIAAQARKYVKHTPAQKAELRRLKKKTGACGQRRAARRAHLQPGAKKEEGAA